MREIKFRAWDMLNATIGNVKEISFHNQICIYGIAKSSTDDNWTWQPMKLKDVILMQYTGLKDSRGVDIYEGDILSADGQTWDVRWISENDNWDFTGFQMEQTYSQNWHRSEIIGNIYENPELL